MINSVSLTVNSLLLIAHVVVNLVRSKQYTLISAVCSRYMYATSNTFGSRLRSKHKSLIA